MRSDLKLIDQSIDSLINWVNDIFIISSTFPLDLNVAVSGVKSPRSVFLSILRFNYWDFQVTRTDLFICAGRKQQNCYNSVSFESYLLRRWLRTTEKRFTVLHEGLSGSFFSAVWTTKCWISRQERSGFASKTSVKIPAAKGAAQDFPENDVTHLLNKKVVWRWLKDSQLLHCKPTFPVKTTPIVKGLLSS